MVEGGTLDGVLSGAAVMGLQAASLDAASAEAAEQTAVRRDPLAELTGGPARLVEAAMGVSAKAARTSPVPSRVLIYGMNYAPELIGCGRYTGEIGAYLAAEGAAVEVVTTPPHYPEWQAARPHRALAWTVERRGRERISRCPILLRREMRGIWRMLAPLSFALSSAPVALWRILTTRPEVVLVVEPTLFAAPAALLGAWLVGARTVLHVQDLEIDAAFAVGHLKGGLPARF